MTADITDLLNKAKKFIRPPQERTLFSLGARGYYENPASDVLRFFLDPRAEHGFRDLFLQAFFDCVKGWEALKITGVSVDREWLTEEGKRLDFVIQADEWVLLVENKIRHAQVNDFAAYSRCGEKIKQSRRLFRAVLSPQGTSVATEWKPISYREYCSKLREKLSDEFFNRPLSKWIILAREFILHLENELYQLPMTENEASFIEENSDAIEQMQKLSSDYRKFLAALLQDSLGRCLPGQKFMIREEAWGGYSCDSSAWKEAHLIFWRDKAEQGGKFRVSAYLPKDLSGAQRDEAERQFRDMKYSPESDRPIYSTSPGFDSRSEAIAKLCACARSLSQIFPALPTPTAAQSSESPDNPVT